MVTTPAKPVANPIINPHIKTIISRRFLFDFLFFDTSTLHTPIIFIYVVTVYNNYGDLNE